MIKVTQTMGKDEQEVLLSLSMNSANAKKFRKSTGILLIVLAAFLILLTVLRRSVVFAVLTVIVLLFAAFGLKPYTKWCLQRGYRNANEGTTPYDRTYQIDEQGIVIQSEDSENQYTWSAFTEYGRSGHYLWIMRNDRKAIILDENHLDANEKAELSDYLKQLKAQ